MSNPDDLCVGCNADGGGLFGYCSECCDTLCDDCSQDGRCEGCAEDE